MILGNTLVECNCKKKKCERHGKCNECIEYHTKNPKYVPYCQRKKVSASDVLKIR